MTRKDLLDEIARKSAETMFVFVEENLVRRIYRAAAYPLDTLLSPLHGGLPGFESDCRGLGLVIDHSAPLGQYRLRALATREETP